MAEKENEQRKEHERQLLLDAYQAGLIDKTILAQRLAQLDVDTTGTKGDATDWIRRPWPQPKGRPEAKNLEVIKGVYEAINKHDMDGITSFMADEHYDLTWMGREAVSPLAVCAAFVNAFKAFPDWTETIEDVIANDGDTVVIRVTGRGTHLGEFGDMKPTGRQITASYINAFRIEDGRIKVYQSTNPFVTPFNQEPTNAEFSQIARAEQGVPASGRCQALVPPHWRRCQNQAMGDSPFCDVHQNAAQFNPEEIRVNHS